ncbi:hypothetical protein K1719_017122 [Acacia pycnantha]|nr:hypothetical protein K1719_034171 [Acacia pycnantha]KAI9111432.1 hypothetical protein K1719_017122 [Acacia pycnantha]
MIPKILPGTVSELGCYFLLRFVHEVGRRKSNKKMFFHIVLERNMQLHPRYFGRNLRDNLVSKLMKDVEGTCSGRHGFVVAVTGIENIGKGLIRRVDCYTWNMIFIVL